MYHELNKIINLDSQFENTIFNFYLLNVDLYSLCLYIILYLSDIKSFLNIFVISPYLCEQILFILKIKSKHNNSLEYHAIIRERFREKQYILPDINSYDFSEMRQYYSNSRVEIFELVHRLCRGMISHILVPECSNH